MQVFDALRPLLDLDLHQGLLWVMRVLLVVRFVMMVVLQVGQLIKLYGLDNI